MKTSNRKVSRLLGILNYDGPPKTLKEMEEAVARGALQRYACQFHALKADFEQAASEAEDGAFNSFYAHAFEPDAFKE